MKTLSLVALVLALLVVIAGCQTYPVDEFSTEGADDEASDSDDTEDTTEDDEDSSSVTDVPETPEDVDDGESTPEVTGNTVVEVQSAPRVSSNSGLPRKIVYEGELVSFPALQQLTTDADGDPITIDWPDPLDENGEWQTQKGDAAEYLLVFSISDGRTERNERLVLEVRPDNKPPVMQPISDVEVLEGENIVFDPIVSDPDGDAVRISYEGFMTTSTYKTTQSDIGSHTVTITATDGLNEVRQDIDVTVLKKNRAPLIESLSDIVVTEGDTVQIDVVAADPDGDSITTSFSRPTDSTGQWVTEEGDDGIYTVTVSVSDGVLTSTETVRVTVNPLNMPPTLSNLADVTVQEGDTVTLSPVASDPEGQDVTITYTGWMTTNTKTTGSQDAGAYTVKITASDGVKSTIETIVVTVEDVNNPPSFPEGNWWE